MDTFYNLNELFINQCYINEYYLKIYINISYLFMKISIGLFCIYILSNIVYDIPVNIFFIEKVKNNKQNIITYLDKILTYFLTLKMNIKNIYEYLYVTYYEPYFVEKGFKIQNMMVCDDYCNNRTIIGNKINSNTLNPEIYKSLIYSTFNFNESVGLPNYYDINNDNVYIKIYYTYDNKDYMFVYNNEMARNNVIVPIPFYDESIIENFKKDSIKPYYEKHNKDASLYSLFHIDCKKIKSVKYNGIEDPNNIENQLIFKSINEYKGYLNDFGLMYKCALKVKHVLSGSDLNNFKSLEIEYEAPYFDEVTFDIIPHIIKLTSKEDYIISDYIKNILEKRNNKLEKND